MSMIMVDIPGGSDVIDYLTARLQKLGITTGAIVALIGALDRCESSVMNRNGADVVLHHNNPSELQGTGEIVNGVPHIHVTLGLQTGGWSGHLLTSVVSETYFVHAYIIPVE
jgi:hypothetical protein